MKKIKRIILMSVAVLSFGSYSFALSVTDFLAYYPMDGNANDVSGHGKHGIINGATLDANGFQGQAYRFDGSNDYISIPLDINPSLYPQLTMGAWVSATSTNPIRQIISHDNGGYDRSLGIDNRGGGAGWSAFSGSSGVVGFTPVVSNTWAFVAVSYNQSNPSVMLYVNGTTFSEAGTMWSGLNATRIGSNPSYGEYFGGKIDNVFFINKALTVDELNDIAQHGVTVPEPSSLALFSIGGILLGLISRLKKKSA